MVVVAIIAGMVALVVPRMGNQDYQIKSAVRRFASLTRQLQNAAKLEGATYRLVIEMPERNSGDPHRYWVERSQQETLIPNPEDDVRTQKHEDDEKKDPSPFRPAEKFVPEPKELEGGVEFKDVEVVNREAPIEEGKAFIYFFPEGLVQESVIHLKLENIEWSVAIHPLTGQSEIVTKYMSLKEIRDQ